MPAIHITVNGVLLCSIGSDDVWHISASLYADAWGPEHSSLTVTGGGKKRPDGSSDFLIWHMSHPLEHGDRICFSFDEGTSSHPKGELHIDDTDPEAEKIDFFAPVPEEEQLRMESLQKLNAHCQWRFISTGNPEIIVKPDDTRQKMSLHLSWNEMRPQRMRISLSKNSLREVLSRSPGESLYEAYVEVGAQVDILIDA